MCIYIYVHSRIYISFYLKRIYISNPQHDFSKFHHTNLSFSLWNAPGCSYLAKKRTNQRTENRSNTLRCTADDPCFRKINLTADEETKQCSDTLGNTIVEERTDEGGQRDSWFSSNSPPLSLSLSPSLSLSVPLSLFLSLSGGVSRRVSLSRLRWRAAGSIQRLVDAISVDVGGKSNTSEKNGT